MKFAQVSDGEAAELREYLRMGSTLRVRQRAHALLLSAKGYQLDALADIFEVDRDTVSAWIEAWTATGFAALEDAPRSGRPPRLDAGQRARAVALAAARPRQIGPALAEAKKGGCPPLL